MRKTSVLVAAAGLLVAGSAMAAVISTDSVVAYSSDLPDYNRNARFISNDSFDQDNTNNPDSSANGHTCWPSDTMWLTNAAQYTPNPWVVIQLGDTSQTVASMHVWNYNELGSAASDAGADANLPYTSRGAKNIEILSSDNNLDWTSQGNFVLAQAPGTDGYMGEGFNFASSFNAKYVKIAISSNYGDSNEFGLSEVQFSTTPVPEPATLGSLALAGLALLRRRH